MLKSIIGQYNHCLGGGHGGGGSINKALDLKKNGVHFIHIKISYWKT